jgi:hypothetical protein
VGGDWRALIFSLLLSFVLRQKKEDCIKHLVTKKEQ